MPNLMCDNMVFEFIERAYAAGCDPTLWPEFVTEVQAQLPGTLIGIQLSLNNTALATRSSAAGIADEHFQSYFDHYQYINPYTPLFARSKVGNVETSRTLLRNEDIKNYAFYHEWLKPAGDFTHGAGATLLRDDERLLHISINIPDHIGHIEPFTAHLLHKLGPHLLRAFQLNERFEAETVAAATLDVLMEKFSGAVFIISNKGRVLFQNEEAEELARKTAILRFGIKEQLSFCLSKNAETYSHVLASILDPSKPPASTSFQIDCGEDGVKTATLLPLRIPGDGHALAEWPSALLVIHVARDIAVPRQVLQSLYGLTNAETEVAIRIASGLGPAEIAEELSVAKTTVRNQLSSIMCKMNVKRQSQIAALNASHLLKLKLERE